MTTRMKIFIILISILTFGTFNVSLAEEDIRHTLANQLVELTLTKQMHHEAYTAFLTKLEDRTLLWKLDDPEALINAYMEVEEAYLSDPASSHVLEIKQMVTKLYQRRYSEAELQKMVEFYKTDVGKKAVAELPLMGYKALFMLNTRSFLTPKYQQMLLDKLRILQKNGKLPENLKLDELAPNAR